MDNDRDVLLLGVVIGAIVILAFGIIMLIDANTLINSIEQIKVEGKVTNVEVFDDYLLVTFNNDPNEIYKINYPRGFGDNTLDFTVNSKLIVKMSRTTENGIILKWKDDAYDVNSIIKIPDNLEQEVI